MSGCVEFAVRDTEFAKKNKDLTAHGKRSTERVKSRTVPARDFFNTRV
jgi:hypothetical protein